MLSEGNVISTPGTNALTGVFRIKPTPLDSGLRKLADAQPEQTPEKGVGALKRKRFWVDLAGSVLAPEELFARFRVRFGELTPLLMNVHAEPGAPTILEKGTTITMALPARGHVQVYDRPANLADWLLMRTVGDSVQARSWESLVKAMVAESGATSASPIQHVEDYLDEGQADRVEGWITDLVIDR